MSAKVEQKKIEKEVQDDLPKQKEVTSERNSPKRKAAITALEKILIRCVMCFREEMRTIKDIPGNLPDLSDDETLDVVREVLINTDSLNIQSIEDDNQQLSTAPLDDSCNLEIPLSPQTPETVSYIPPAHSSSPPQPLQTVNFYPNNKSSKKSEKPLQNPNLDTTRPSDYSAALQELQADLPPTPSRPRRNVPARDYSKLHSRGFYQN